MTWCSDVCLACDRQTYGTAYCSQVCRLSDLEISGPSSSSLSSSIRDQHSFPFYSSADRGWYPSSPSINLHKRDSRPESTSLPQERPTQRLSASQSLFGRIVYESHLESQRHNGAGVSPSSSGSSLSSIRSSLSGPNRLSPKAVDELKSYDSFFDQTRHVKRQRSLY